MLKNIGVRALNKNLNDKIVYGSLWHIVLPQETMGTVFDVFCDATKTYTLVPVSREKKERGNNYGMYRGKQRIGWYPDKRAMLAIPFDKSVPAFERFYNTETGVYTLSPLTVPTDTYFGEYTGTRVLRIDEIGKLGESATLSVLGIHCGKTFTYFIEGSGIIHLVPPEATKTYPRGKKICSAVARGSASFALITTPRACLNYLVSLGVKLEISALYYARYYDKDSGVYTFVPLRKKATKQPNTPISGQMHISEDMSKPEKFVLPPHVCPPKVVYPSDVSAREFLGCFKTREKSENNYLCSIDLPYAFIEKWYDIYVDAHTGVITLTPKGE